MQTYVCTIFFEELLVERPIYGGYFKLPAVSKGNPPYLVEIKDHIQHEPLPFISGGGQVPRVVYAHHIAADIVSHVAELGLGMSTDCGPGVWALRDRIPEMDADGKLLLQADGKPITRSATDKERNALFAEDMERAARRQERYGEYLISQGDAYDKTPKERILITNRMKTAARYYMREVPWIHELKAEDHKLCPFCLSSIDSRALKCPSCNEIVEPARYAAVTAGKRAAVKETVAQQ